MEAARFKGYALISMLKWVRTACSPAHQQQIILGLPMTFQEEIPKLRAGEWYPIDWANALFEGIASARGRSQPEQRAAVEEVVAFVCRDNLGSVLALLMTFMTPTVLFKKLPSFWLKYYKTPTTLGVEVNPDGTGGTVSLDFAEACYLDIQVATWIKVAFAALKVEVVIRETKEDPAGASFRWEVRWR